MSWAIGYIAGMYVTYITMMKVADDGDFFLVAAWTALFWPLLAPVALFFWSAHKLWERVR